MYLCIYRQTICCFRNSSAFCRSFKEIKKRFFWVSHFTPDCGAIETVFPVSNKQFLQYNLKGIQLLMYMLFIPIVWFAFQYNFMHYTQFFKESYWVSLCLKCLIMPRTTLLLFNIWCFFVCYKINNKRLSS